MTVDTDVGVVCCCCCSLLLNSLFLFGCQSSGLFFFSGMYKSSFFSSSICFCCLLLNLLFLFGCQSCGLFFGSMYKTNFFSCSAASSWIHYSSLAANCVASFSLATRISWATSAAVAAAASFFFLLYTTSGLAAAAEQQQQSSPRLFVVEVLSPLEWRQVEMFRWRLPLLLLSVSILLPLPPLVV